MPDRVTAKEKFYYTSGSGGSRISLKGGGAPTPEAATFRKICMSKRKNLDPWGARRRRPPGSANASENEDLKQLTVDGLSTACFTFCKLHSM